MTELTRRERAELEIIRKIAVESLTDP